MRERVRGAESRHSCSFEVATSLQIHEGGILSRLLPRCQLWRGQVQLQGQCCEHWASRRGSQAVQRGWEPPPEPKECAGHVCVELWGSRLAPLKN